MSRVVKGTGVISVHNFHVNGLLFINIFMVVTEVSFASRANLNEALSNDSFKVPLDW